ncbi:MAG: metalloprotease TldD [Alphaproteobacteria bacterium]|jgi:TldD protein|nr:metalloprotease TldD [Alphaproteobacteria bacterium]MDP7191123.1 metalloprotease TldD [Alphaproteobacteria bacterium]MDP7456803.1 metalloprotease TldD [Alphaproteobacteria bacterium]HJO89252.1 metalloprotease TldD [Alphaproteobacteria bacterium]
MSDLATTDALFFERTGLNRERTESQVNDALAGCDDGELFLEYCQSESLNFDDGRLKTASFDTSQGFGLRCVAGETTGYAHASELSEVALRRAAETVKSVRTGRQAATTAAPQPTNRHLYDDANPLGEREFTDKVNLLSEMDAYARSRDPRVRQVSASLSGQWQAMQIIRPGGQRVCNVRPLVRLNVTVTAAKGERMEQGTFGSGGRAGYGQWLKPETWKASVDEALRQALVNLESVATPAGEMTVVVGPGWPGILLHEAVGHGLEGDFNRKNTSAFSGLIGERVAEKGVTVVDDGTLENLRGSLTIDDEGTPADRTVLIEDGILKSYMFDRMNARLMGAKPTGNGRRQSYAHAPMPRMTNTYMLGGSHQHDEIIATVKKGVYAVSFGGGQVDITSGKFVFNASEAYLIEDGKVGAPVKGATLIGNGPDVLTRVSMIGNDMALDPGIGTCGKEGQHVPVGVGQPTLKIDGLTVGGTES